MTSRKTRARLLAPSFLVVATAWGCGDNTEPVPSTPGLFGVAGSGGGGGGGGGSAGSASCPTLPPTSGEPCEGERQCTYPYTVGCSPPPIVASCRERKWSVSLPMPYLGPCNPPGPVLTCPPTLPQLGMLCGFGVGGPGAIPAGAPPLFCSYPDPACASPRIASCGPTPFWQVTPCDAVGGAGGEGGASGEGGVGGEGGAAGAGEGGGAGN